MAGAVPFAADSTTPVDLTGLSADQQIQAGLFCGSVFPTLSTPIVTCDPKSNLAPHQFINPSCFTFPTQIGQNGPYVFVVLADSTLELRQVKPGQPQGDLVVINEGVEKGETVVTSGQLQLAPKMKVNPRESGPDGNEKPALR